MSAIGGMLVELDGIDVDSVHKMKRLLNRVMPRLESGRSTFFTWNTDFGLTPQVNWEYLLGTVFLLEPKERVLDEDWVFASNGAVRVFDHEFVYKKTLFWTEVRKKGEMAYSRRKVIGESELNKSQIPVTDPAFTRDVANNVWNLLETSHRAELLDRIRALTTWPDEEFMHISADGERVLTWEPLDLSKAVIPKAVKTYYPYLDNALF